MPQRRGPLHQPAGLQAPQTGGLSHGDQADGLPRLPYGTLHLAAAEGVQPSGAGEGGPAAGGGRRGRTGARGGAGGAGAWGRRASAGRPVRRPRISGLQRHGALRQDGGAEAADGALGGRARGWRRRRAQGAAVQLLHPHARHPGELDDALRVQLHPPGRHHYPGGPPEASRPLQQFGLVLCLPGVHSRRRPRPQPHRRQ
mmetsp:Transcript_25427/g.65475  ORF Transcript_25427/g.65475 Transcript_25427/m.65475 type:complete len:200 (+) Transcript_25427:946-1545(+)